MEGKLTSVSGVVVDFPQARQSKAGKEYVELLLKDGKAGIWKVMFFQNVLAALEITLDSKITVLGKTEGATIFASSFTSGVPSKIKEFKAYGHETPEMSKATTKANAKRRNEEGWVWCEREKSWRKRDDCVSIGLEWMTKLDFIMMKLGETRINNEAREWLGHSSPTRLARGASSLDVKGWQALKEKWLTEAQEGF